MNLIKKFSALFEKDKKVKLECESIKLKLKKDAKIFIGQFVIIESEIGEDMKYFI